MIYDENKTKFQSNKLYGININISNFYFDNYINKII